VDIYAMTVGEKMNMDAKFKAIPLKLALGLIEDMDHKIQLSLPVSGNINSPKFSYSKIIWKAIGNVLLKAVASPWVALGQAMGMDGEDLSSIEIDPLQPDFTSEQYARIDKLVEIMKTQDELNLALVQQFDMPDAIAQRAVFDLKKAYFQHRHESKANLEHMSLADIEDIRDIRNSDKGLLDFTRELTGVEGSLQQQAEAFYSADTLRQEVLQFAEIRNRTLEMYLTRQQQLPASRVRVETLGVDDLNAYSGKNHYEVSSDLGFDFDE